jgi:DNA polymerase III subunit epsilon
VDRAELNTLRRWTADAPLAFVDVETTGGSASSHRIIEVAVVGTRGVELEFEWKSLINPGTHIPSGIEALTGIGDDLVADAPAFDAIAAQLAACLEGRLFIAHNARFDYGFIQREFRRTGTQWRSDSLCTVRLSRALNPELASHSLDSLIGHHALQVSARHRALPDAQALHQLWREWCSAWPAEELQRAIDHAARRPELPPALPPGLLDDLPETPGVYRLFGGEAEGADELLYIGKANNLRERVLDHFRGNDAKSRRLSAQTRRVTWSETAGELGALLQEAREIRERQPVYNKQLRGACPRFTWVFPDGGSPRLAELDADLLRSGNAYGAWRTEREARRALEQLGREHHWCFKALGLETGEGSCVGLQVGRCEGACVGREPIAAHLARVRIGLARQHLPHWPHSGPVVVSEGEYGRRQYHLIDAWQHLATFDEDEAADTLAEFARSVRRAREEFDADVFHILKRALRQRRVMPLPVPAEDPWS